MHDVTQTDIFISGGGLAGLTAAVAFAHEGYSVICADPAPPITDGDSVGSDLRTTALLQPSRSFLDSIGLWEGFAPHATPLQVMRIVDAGGEVPEARVAHDFDAADISELPFGWNLPNWVLRRELVAHLERLPSVDFRPGTATRDVLSRDAEVRVTLDDGSRIAARLVIGADGRLSPVREAAGIGVRTTRYGQKAMAFAVSHAIPHENVSTEIHRSGGPFTLVPLPDRADARGVMRPCSAVVWMERGPEAKRLMALDEEAFNAEMSERSAYLFGPLTLVSRRTVWPIISQVAERMSAGRIALIAEAAHVLPPIGAQGLNMSIADIRTLSELLAASDGDPGDAGLLSRYHRRRHAEVLARVTGIDLLNRASMAGSQTARDLRMRALDGFYAVKPVRRVLMQAGLGARG